MEQVNSIDERLDKLKELIQSEEFLTGKGLSNEVNIRMFCYKPDLEMRVRCFTENLVKDTKLNCNLKVFDLYQLFLELCKNKKILDKIEKMEENKGQDFLEKQLIKISDPRVMASMMKYEPHVPGDVILLTGVGKVFPFMRVHALLEALQPLFTDVPIVVLYPGKYDGHELQLFEQLSPNGYYRAFNTI